MVILTLAPRRWGKTHNCVHFFKLFSLMKLDPLLVVLNTHTLEYINDCFYIPNYCNENNIITSSGDSFLQQKHSDILILDEYCFFQVESKKHIYDLRHRFKHILIWSSFGIDKKNDHTFDFDFLKNRETIMFRYNINYNKFNLISKQSIRLNYDDLFELNIGNFVCEMNHGGQIYNYGHG